VDPIGDKAEGGWGQKFTNNLQLRLYRQGIENQAIDRNQHRNGWKQGERGVECTPGGD
jgi:hypothetical protein